MFSTFRLVIFLLSVIFLSSFKVGFFGRQTTFASMSASKSKSIRDFGYDINADGQLRKIDTNTGEPGDEPFDFNISDDHATNQRNYEELGDAITHYVYDLMEKNGLHKIHVPDNIPKDKATCIFANNEDLKESKKLMVLIHGSGVVRAGQWSRSLIINHSLNHGTQLPYIKKALEQGYDVLVMNTNDNYREVDGELRRIPGHGSPMDHAVDVWEKYVIEANPQSVGIVAHSYGGAVTLHLAKKFSSFFTKKVFAVGFTDSVHTMSGVSDNVRTVLRDVGRNWVTSSKPVDEKENSQTNDMPRYSAGHTKHEWTSYSCMDALFKFFDEKYEDFINKHDPKKKVDL